MWQDFGKSRQSGSPPEQGDPHGSTRGVYPHPTAGGRTLYRAFHTESGGVPPQKRGLTSPSAAAKFRARMQVRAERGELRITPETFAEHFDGWLKGHDRASQVTRDHARAASDRGLRVVLFVGQRTSSRTRQLQPQHPVHPTPPRSCGDRQRQDGPSGARA
jgi:hypothetical protein